MWIQEACSYYISEVSEVLRNQKSCATYLQVFLHTNYFSNHDQQYSKSITVTLGIPTNNTFILISEAKKALNIIYKPGYRFKKVGVCLSGIIPSNYVQGNLFIPTPRWEKNELMSSPRASPPPPIPAPWPAPGLFTAPYGRIQATKGCLYAGNSI